MDKVPVVNFKAGENFDTFVSFVEEGAYHLMVELGLKLGSMLILQDEFGIKYVSRITEVTDYEVVVKIEELLKDRLIYTDNAGVRGRIMDNKKRNKS